MVVEDGDYGTAGVWTIVVLALSFVVVLLMGAAGRRHKKRATAQRRPLRSTK